MIDKWTFEKIQQEALKYNTRTEFQSNSAYDAAQKRHILDEVCSHMKEIRHSWTDEELQEEAFKYNTRKDFRNNNGSAYQLAFRRNILNKICFHMKKMRRSWTDEELHQEALKYKNRIDFQNNNQSAYNIALKRNLLDKICTHMKRSCGISLLEQTLLHTIKQRYPKARRLRDTKVNICGKKHIQGFEIDIYIPELHKGIEFDGDYWHSIEGLRRSRENWPQEDLENYHKIKDDYFLSKGIKLFHIKEEDWLKDQELCLQNCLNFLNT
ncbi:MAG TPA: hypothetical protein VN855_00130 [Candidatus Acidoferrum sp.]|nr:hypothetical protein [Candidatus Acidoferrum sp.]